MKVHKITTLFSVGINDCLTEEISKFSRKKAKILQFLHLIQGLGKEGKQIEF